MEPRERIIVALDVPTIDEALDLAKVLHPYVGGFKIGLQLQAVLLWKFLDGMFKTKEKIDNLFDLIDGKIFWDGKFNDIPNTIAGASQVIQNIKVKMFSVHASAGITAMRAAVDNKGHALVLTVTVLSSLEDEEDVYPIFHTSSKAKVLEFARDALVAKCDGVVCSPLELEMLSRHNEFKELLKVVPGVRPVWTSGHDQKRVMTPKEAIHLGADYLVVGRPIICPEKGTPVDATKRIVEEITHAM